MILFTILTNKTPKLRISSPKSGFFGSPIAQSALKTKNLSQWKESYGDEHRKLQTFAIRVLSLPCSSSICEHNWSAFVKGKNSYS